MKLFYLIVIPAIFISLSSCSTSSDNGELYYTISSSANIENTENITFYGGIGGTGEVFKNNTDFTSSIYSVTSGQNVTYSIIHTATNAACKSIILTAFHDGNSIHTRTFDLGAMPCGDQVQQSINIIIP